MLELRREYGTSASFHPRMGERGRRGSLYGRTVDDRVVPFLVNRGSKAGEMTGNRDVGEEREGTRDRPRTRPYQSRKGKGRHDDAVCGRCEGEGTNLRRRRNEEKEATCDGAAGGRRPRRSLPLGHVFGARERLRRREEEGTSVGGGPTLADSEYTRDAMSPGEGEDWALLGPVGARQRQ